MGLTLPQMVALSIFVIVYFFIISELVHRTVIALLGGSGDDYVRHTDPGKGYQLY